MVQKHSYYDENSSSNEYLLDSDPNPPVFTVSHSPQVKMFFAKAAVPALAVLGLVATVLAGPLQVSNSSPNSTISVLSAPTGAVPLASAPKVSIPIIKRDDLVLSAVQGVLDNVSPLVDTLSKFFS